MPYMTPPGPLRGRQRSDSLDGTNNRLLSMLSSGEHASQPSQEPTRMQRVGRELSLLLIPGLTFTSLFFYFRWVHSFFEGLFPHDVPVCEADPVSYSIPRVWYDDEVHTVTPVTHASLRHEGMTQADFMFQMSVFAAVPAVLLALFSYVTCRFALMQASSPGPAIPEVAESSSPRTQPPPLSATDSASFRGASSHASTFTGVSKADDGQDDLLILIPTSRSGGSLK